LPDSAETCLVHGDYKLDNIMYKKDQIVAVFDWEMATLGDPHDDLGWVCMRYYEVEGLIQGMMERAWFLERYEKASGRAVDPAALRFWQVFANVKMAAITMTGAQRYVSGASRKNILALLPMLLPKLRQDIIELLEF
jgi:aminoglycoside phosphotransferase (APT) family kinase protein